MQGSASSRFEAELLHPAKLNGDAPWAFVVLPRRVSEAFPRRGRTTAEVTVNGYAFRVLLEPDGRLSHWLRLDQEVLEAIGAEPGEVAKFEVRPVEQEPEPEIPTDLQDALTAKPEAQAAWDSTTTLARVDWIHWITSAKQAKTRAKRINDACDMLCPASTILSGRRQLDWPVDGSNCR